MATRLDTLHRSKVVVAHGDRVDSEGAINLSLESLVRLIELLER